MWNSRVEFHSKVSKSRCELKPLMITVICVQLTSTVYLIQFPIVCIWPRCTFSISSIDKDAFPDILHLSIVLYWNYVLPLHLRLYFVKIGLETMKGNGCVSISWQDDLVIYICCCGDIWNCRRNIISTRTLPSGTPALLLINTSVGAL